jgi:hypothetical protein
MTRTELHSRLGAIILAIGAFTATAPIAFAHDPYPSGWNKPDPNVPTPMYSFMPGCWNDTRMHRSDETSCQSAPAARPTAAAAPQSYSMVPGGDRLHNAQ